MTEVNLLPPEFRQRHRSRTLTRQIVMGVVAAVLLVAVVFVIESSKLSQAQSDLAAQNAANAALQTEITSLQRFADLQTELTTKQQLVTSLQADEVQWSGVLHDLSMVMPSDVFLTNFTGQISIGPGGWETAPSDTGLIGNMQFQGVSLNFPNVALWLDRMVNVDGWANSWVGSAALTSTDSSSSSSGSTDASSGVQFSGSVDLTPAAAQNGTMP
jgi:Tfp pilus assembly protein PilN